MCKYREDTEFWHFLANCLFHLKKICSITKSFYSPSKPPKLQDLI